MADNMYERSELGYLICNTPQEYADLVLNGTRESEIVRLVQRNSDINSSAQEIKSKYMHTKKSSQASGKFGI